MILDTDRPTGDRSPRTEGRRVIRKRCWFQIASVQEWIGTSVHRMPVICFAFNMNRFDKVKSYVFGSWVRVRCAEFDNARVAQAAEDYIINSTRMARRLQIAGGTG